tara:strand:+ start:2525 stop:2923 length:399 start_codon:yes stop_codon:yes gene_type:complete
MITKKLQKIIDSHTGLRFKGTRIYASFTYKRTDIHVGSVHITDREGLYNLIVMLESSRDYLYQPELSKKGFKKLSKASKYLINRKGVVILKDSLYPIAVNQKQVHILQDNGVPTTYTIQCLLRKTFKTNVKF